MSLIKSQIKKLAIGTVQFGLDYGINNTDGKVSINEVNNILAYSNEMGIGMLDTAYQYGESEKILGKSDIGCFEIITKTRTFEGNINDVIDGFYTSLENLNLIKIDGLLIHNIKDIHHKNFDNFFERLVLLKDEGLINKIGFSIYTMEQLDLILNRFDFDLIQLPLNVFDNRLINSHRLEIIKKRGIEIHARSIFLQGVLLNFNNLPKYFISWSQEFSNYQDLVKKSSMTLLEYALNYVLNISEIDRVIVGVNSKVQLEEIINSIRLPNRYEAFPINDHNLLNPSLWKI